LKIYEQRGRLREGVAITFVVPQTAMEVLYAKDDSNRVYNGLDEIGGTGIETSIRTSLRDIKRPLL